jgi:hypothetical protein
MPRGPEPRINKRAPDSYPKSSVCLTVAAEFLECDVKTLGKWLSEGLIEYLQYGRRRRIEVVELVAFRRRQLVERKAG